MTALQTSRRVFTQRRREALTGLFFISPWLIGFLVFTLAAMLFSLGLVFVETDLLSGIRFTGLSNLTQLAKDPLFRTSLKITTYYSLVTVPLSLVIGLVIALGLNQGLPAQGLWRTLYYLPADHFRHRRGHDVDVDSAPRHWAAQSGTAFRRHHRSPLALLEGVGAARLHPHGRLGRRREHAALPGRPAEHPHRSCTKRRASTAPTPGAASGTSPCPCSRPPSSST